MGEIILRTADVAAIDLWDSGSASYQLYSLTLSDVSMIMPGQFMPLGTTAREQQSDITTLIDGGIEYIVGLDNIERVEMAGFMYNLWCQTDINLPLCTSLSSYAFAMFGGYPLSGEPTSERMKTLTLSVPALTSWNMAALYNTKFSTIYFRDLQTIPSGAFDYVGEYLTDIYLPMSLMLAHPGGRVVNAHSLRFHVPGSLVSVYSTATGWSNESLITWVSI